MATTKKFDICVKILHSMEPVKNADYQIEIELIAHITGELESDCMCGNTYYWVVRNYEIQHVAQQTGLFIGDFEQTTPWQLIPVKDIDQRLADQFADEIVDQWLSGQKIEFPMIPDRIIKYYTPLANVLAV